MNLLSKTTEQVCAFDEDATQSDKESDDNSEYDNLDECINEGLAASGSLHSIAKLIKGREPLSKRTKTGDLQPIVYVAAFQHSSEECQGKTSYLTRPDRYRCIGNAGEQEARSEAESSENDWNRMEYPCGRDGNV